MLSRCNLCISMTFCLTKFWIIRFQRILLLLCALHLTSLLHPPRSFLPRSLQLTVVQVGASCEQVECSGQGDCDHTPAPSHIRVARDGASMTGGALDTPSSWRGDSVGIGSVHLLGYGWMSFSSFSSISRHGPQLWAFYRVNLKGCSTISSARSRLSPHR